MLQYTGAVWRDRCAALLINGGDGMDFDGVWYDSPDDVPVCGNCLNFSSCGVTGEPDDSFGNFSGDHFFNEELGGYEDGWG